MLYFSNFRLEIAAKFISKFSGLFKQVAVIFFIGANTDIDHYYVATSFSSLILSLIAWSEIELLPLLTKARVNEPSGTSVLTETFVKYLISLALLILLLLSLITYFTMSLEIMIWTLLIGVWSILNLVNNIWLMEDRVNDQMATVFRYYSNSSIVGMVLFLCASITISAHKWSDSYYVYALYASILIPEIYYLFTWYIKKPRCLYPTIGAIHFAKIHLFTRSSASVLFILLLVYGIDAVAKYFTTLSIIDGASASLLVYGSMVPLILRNIFDVKTLFFSEINKTQSLSLQLGLLKKILIKVMQYYTPVISVVIVLGFLFARDIVVLLHLNFTDNQVQKMIEILIIYSLIVPMYILWDLCYRFFHLYNYKMTVSLLVAFCFFINVFINYTMCFYFRLGITGIALTTLIIYFIYSLASITFLLFLKRKKHENINS